MNEYYNIVILEFPNKTTIKNIRSPNKLIIINFILSSIKLAMIYLNTLCFVFQYELSTSKQLFIIQNEFLGMFI